ncbi:MAG: F0F1 ATP synthase subunit epsilon [Chloroflexota bacterium]|nr:F0F1 ATP synthase subunit epsilon [Chloroflexota bacterium]
MAKLRVEIVTGERVVYEQDDVDMVVAPGIDGTLGILPHHAPLITVLSSGELRVKKGGSEQALVVFGGFLEVTPDRVIVLADTAENVEEIDLARAEEARRRAEASIANRQDVVDMDQAQAELRRATLRLRVGQRRTGRRSPIPGGTSE